MKLFALRGFSVGFFKFHRSIKIAPGIKINFNKKSTSLTLGRKGIHTTISKSGIRNTVGLPGSGLSYTSYNKFDSHIVDDAVPYTRVCPNCGHNMRKAWRNCPKCSFDLLSLYAPVEPKKDSSWEDVKRNYKERENDVSGNKKDSGCGCLLIVFILLLIFWILS